MSIHVRVGVACVVWWCVRGKGSIRLVEHKCSNHICYLFQHTFEFCEWQMANMVRGVSDVIHLENKKLDQVILVLLSFSSFVVDVVFSFLYQYVFWGV